MDKTYLTHIIIMVCSAYLQNADCNFSKLHCFKNFITFFFHNLLNDHIKHNN